MQCLKRFSLQGLLLFTPLLLGCKGDKRTAVPTDFMFDPTDCQDGDIIGVNAEGMLACVAPPQGTLLLKPCLSDQVLTGETGTLKCVNKGNGSADATIVARIMNAQAQLNQLTFTIDNFQNSGGRPTKYLGNTSTPTTGRITSGNKVGLPAAAERCKAQYTASPTAHMCTVYEMYEAVATNQITEAMTISKAWVFMVGWNNAVNAAPAPSTQEGEAGMNDNCANYHYPTAANRWTGTAVAWEPIVYFGAANEKALKFYSGPTQGTCAMYIPIACCE